MSKGAQIILIWSGIFALGLGCIALTFQSIHLLARVCLALLGGFLMIVGWAGNFLSVFNYAPEQISVPTDLKKLRSSTGPLPYTTKFEALSCLFVCLYVLSVAFDLLTPASRLIFILLAVVFWFSFGQFEVVPALKEFRETERRQSELTDIATILDQVSRGTTSG